MFLLTIIIVTIYLVLLKLFISTRSEPSNPSKEEKNDEQKTMLASLKGKRRVHKSRISKLVDSIDNYLKDSPPNIELIKFAIEDLENQQNCVLYYNTLILKYINAENKISEIEDSEKEDHAVVQKLAGYRLFIRGPIDQTEQQQSKNALSKTTENVINLNSAKSVENQTENILIRKKDLFVKLTKKTIIDLKNVLASKEVDVVKVKALRKELLKHKNIINNLVEEIFIDLPIGFVAMEQNVLFQREINSQLELVEIYLENEKSSSITSSKTKTNGRTNFKLERIAIPTFDGDITDYLAWKQSFFAAVDSQDLTTQEKQMHLRNSLKGNALKLISGLPQTNEHYKEVLDLLETSYNDEIKIISNHLDVLSSLKPPAYKYQALLDFYSLLESHVRALQSHGIGITPTDSGIVIGHSLAKILPKEVKDEVKEQKKGKHWDLTLIRRAIKDSIIYLRADVEENENESIKKPSSERKPINLGISNQNYSLESYHPKQSTMATTVQDQAANVNRPCVFCKQEGHFDGKCRIYKTCRARRDRVKELNLCFMCLNKGHSVRECRGNYKPCFHCRDWNHKSPMCPRNPNFTTEEETKEQHSSNNHVGFSSTSSNLLVRQTSSPNVALPLAVLNINHLNKQHRIKSLIDIGSQRSLIRQSAVDKLQLRSHKSVNLKINGINVNGKLKKYEIVALSIINRGKPIRIEAIVVNKLPNNLIIPHLPEVTRRLKQKGVWLANPNQTTSHINDINIVIGSDFYHRFCIKPYQFDNINLLDSKVNSMIYGVLPTSNKSKKVANNIASILQVNIEPAKEIYDSTNRPVSSLIIPREELNKSELNDIINTKSEKKIEEHIEISALSSLTRGNSLTRPVFRNNSNLPSNGEESQMFTKVKGKFIHNLMSETTASENICLQQNQRSAFETRMLKEGKCFSSTSKYKQFSVF